MLVCNFPINDLLAQAIKNNRLLSQEDTEIKIAKMKNCKHLFLILKEKENGEKIFECVHCSLTNKFLELEDHPNEEEKNLFMFKHHQRTLQSQVFLELENKDNLINKNELLSTKTLDSLHPSLLYHIAKELYPNGSNEEIFIIMKILHYLETAKEKERLQILNQASDLIKRYKEIFCHIDNPKVKKRTYNSY